MEEKTLLHEDMSIADLKAAYDFIREDIKNIEAEAGSKKIPLEKVHDYQIIKSLETSLYHTLLNKTRDLA
jgi:hypothetical protein